MRVTLLVVLRGSLSAVPVPTNRGCPGRSLQALGLPRPSYGSAVIGSILTITGSWPPDRRRFPPNFPAMDGQLGCSSGSQAVTRPAVKVSPVPGPEAGVCHHRPCSASSGPTVPARAGGLKAAPMTGNGKEQRWDSRQRPRSSTLHPHQLGVAPALRTSYTSPKPTVRGRWRSSARTRRPARRHPTGAAVKDLRPGHPAGDGRHGECGKDERRRITLHYRRSVRIPVRVSLHRAAGPRQRTGCAAACHRPHNGSRMVAQHDPIVHCAAVGGDAARAGPGESHSRPATLASSRSPD